MAEADSDSETEDAEGPMLKHRIISQKTYPTNEMVGDEKTEGTVKSTLEKIREGDEELYRVLSFILSSSVRSVEALNGFVYMDKRLNRLIWQTPAEKNYVYDPNAAKSSRKKYVSAFTVPTRGFFGIRFLNALLQKDEAWKGRPIINVYNLDLGWLEEFISDDQYNPTWLFKDVMYDTIHSHLHKTDPFPVYYFRSKKLMATMEEYSPSLHFYRKAFVAGCLRHKIFKNDLDVVVHVGWSDPKILLFYYKTYVENDLAGAARIRGNISFRGE
jgi:hypothetical protein